MIIASCLESRPGKRIEGYRNSEPRHVKLLGVGRAAEAIVQEFSKGKSTNILLLSDDAAHRLQMLDEPVDGVRPNAVIVVYQSGDSAADIPFMVERTASMLSLIVLETNVRDDDRAVPRLRQLREVADLYVTTSDAEFVDELVRNLAS